MSEKKQYKELLVKWILYITWLIPFVLVFYFQKYISQYHLAKDEILAFSIIIFVGFQYILSKLLQRSAHISSFLKERRKSNYERYCDLPKEKEEKILTKEEYNEVEYKHIGGRITQIPFLRWIKLIFISCLIFLIFFLLVLH